MNYNIRTYENEEGIMKDDYEAIVNNGTKYSFKVRDNRVTVFVNDKLWGEPQGGHFMIALIRDILSLKGEIK